MRIVKPYIISSEYEKQKRIKLIFTISVASTVIIVTSFYSSVKTYTGEFLGKFKRETRNAVISDQISNQQEIKIKPPKKVADAEVKVLVSRPSRKRDVVKDKLALASEGQADNRSTRVKSTVYAVSVTSSPSGATVYIDKKQVGTTPLKLTLEQGSHGIGIEKGGYMAIWEPINVQDGRNAFTFNMERE